MSDQLTTKEMLDAIIAEASAFSEFDVRTDDAFRQIVSMARAMKWQLGFKEK